MLKKPPPPGYGYLGSFIIIFLFPVLTFSQGLQAIHHFPITLAQAGQPIRISARLETGGPSPVYVRVYFKSIHEQNFRHLDLRGSLDSYAGEIPGQFVRTPLVQYFILALFPNQKVVSLPSLNPYGNPFQVVVQAVQPSQTDTLRSTVASGQSENTIQIISPEPFEDVAQKEVVIAASFLGSDLGVDSASVRISLDGADVTYLAEVSEFLVTFSPTTLLPGPHTVVVWANDPEGEPLSPLTWKFNVLSSAAQQGGRKGKSYQGRIFAEFHQEKFSGQTLHSNNLGGNIDGTSGPFQYRGLFYVTSLENARFQPRNRFTLTAESKLLEIGIGDIYPYYNELVLWGRRVRGFSGAVKLGFINFQVVTGQSNRLIKPIYTGGAPGVPGTLIAKGSFRQNLMAGRVSFGSGKNFQLGILALKARDDVQSLATGKSNSNPKDNLVAGVDFFLALNSHRFELKASAAYSLLTNDITNGPASKAKINSTFDVNLPFDPADFKDILILNESTVPLDPTGLTSLAYQASLNLNYFRNFLQFGLKRLGPEYNSLGQTYLRNNIKGFYINDRIPFFNNKVYANIGYEDYKDNFGKEDDNPEVTLRTVNFGVSFYPGPSLPTLNFGVRNYLRDNGIQQFLTQTSGIGTIDTTDNREQSLTRDYNFNMTYNFNALNLRHNATISIINSKLIDQFGTTRPTTVAPRDLSTIVQMVSLKSQFERPLTTTVTFATNRNQATRGRSIIKFNLLTGRGDYQVFNNKLSVYAGLRYIAASGAQKSASRTIAQINYTQTGFQLGAIYQPTQHHNLMLDVEWINYRDKGLTLNPATGLLAANPSFKNSIVRLFYEFRL